MWKTRVHTFVRFFSRLRSSCQFIFIYVSGVRECIKNFVWLICCVLCVCVRHGVKLSHTLCVEILLLFGELNTWHTIYICINSALCVFGCCYYYGRLLAIAHAHTWIARPCIRLQLRAIFCDADKRTAMRWKARKFIREYYLLIYWAMVYWPFETHRQRHLALFRCLPFIHTLSWFRFGWIGLDLGCALHCSEPSCCYGRCWSCCWCCWWWCCRRLLFRLSLLARVFFYFFFSDSSFSFHVSNAVICIYVFFYFFLIFLIKSNQHTVSHTLHTLSPYGTPENLFNAICNTNL